MRAKEEYRFRSVPALKPVNNLGAHANTNSVDAFDKGRIMVIFGASYMYSGRYPQEFVGHTEGGQTQKEITTATGISAIIKKCYEELIKQGKISRPSTPHAHIFVGEDVE